jgi:hypothetical protein
VQLRAKIQRVNPRIIPIHNKEVGLPQKDIGLPDDLLVQSSQRDSNFLVGLADYRAALAKLEGRCNAHAIRWRRIPNMFHGSASDHSELDFGQFRQPLGEPYLTDRGQASAATADGLRPRLAQDRADAAGTGSDKSAAPRALAGTRRAAAKAKPMILRMPAVPVRLGAPLRKRADI